MKPVVVLSSAEQTCVSFVWPQDHRFYVGYRFVEHHPKIINNPLPQPPQEYLAPPGAAKGTLSQMADWLTNWRSAYADPEHPLQLTFQTSSDGSAQAEVVQNDGSQKFTWRFDPDADGVWLWITLKTNEPLPGGYILQQCLRLTSGIGYGFYPQVAKVPFLSELFMQALGNANGTMTWTRMNDAWHQFPVPFTRYHPPAGRGIYQDSSGQVDDGLILRESASRTEAPNSYWEMVAPEAEWEARSAGFNWERAAFISNRHPADCLHIGVDFGPLESGESRTVRGKFYWVDGVKDDLLSIWQTDFPDRT